MIRRIVPALLALVMLLAVGCSRLSGTAESRLSEAIESLFEDPFAWTMTVEADRSSLNELGEDAKDAADFLAGLRLSGVFDENETASLDISAFGIDDVAQVIVLGTEALYVRAALDEFSAAAEVEPLNSSEIIADLTSADVDPAVITAVASFLEGDWVGLTGLEDVGDLAGDSAGDEDFDLDDARDSIADIFGSDADEFIERFITFTETTDGDETRYDVVLDVAELIRAANALNDDLGLGGAVPTEDVEDLLGDLPSEVSGVLVVRDGVLSEIVFDLADAARAAGDEVNGSIVVRVTFDDDPPALAAPAGAPTVTTDQLGDAVSSFFAFQAEDLFRDLEEQFGEFGSEFPTDFPTDFDFGDE